ncbi:hypothetical protein KDA00_05830 [Candidatus Saccharibacteria bacterium]|nr:hypothetical protein [Candidatus Saccharibacteria bacterium]
MDLAKKIEISRVQYVGGIVILLASAGASLYTMLSPFVTIETTPSRAISAIERRLDNHESDANKHNSNLPDGDKRKYARMYQIDEMLNEFYKVHIVPLNSKLDKIDAKLDILLEKKGH